MSNDIEIQASDKPAWARIVKGDFGYETAGESDSAYQAFVDYYALGTKRSLRALAHMYIKHSKDDSQAKPPTLREATIFTWSTTFDWQNRVKAWMEHDSQLFLAQREGLRSAIEQSEFEDYNRLRSQWTRLFNSFAKAFNDPDYKSSGTGTLLALVEARRRITELGRLSLGLPSDIKEARLGDSETNPISISRIEYRLPAPDEDAV